MASGKLSPRQKMINMMYLVLTALLALNVSKEVLNSFLKLTEELREQLKALHQKMMKHIQILQQRLNLILSKPVLSETKLLRLRKQLMR